MVDSASCDIIDLTAGDEEVRLSSRHAAKTEPASKQGCSQPHQVQCKADPSSIAWTGHATSTRQSVQTDRNLSTTCRRSFSA